MVKEVLVQERKWHGKPMKWFSVRYFPQKRCQKSSVRVHDVGRKPGFHQRMACQVKGKWKTMSWRLPTSEYKVEKVRGKVNLIPTSKKAFDMYRRLTRDYKVKLIRIGKHKGEFQLQKK